MDLLHLTAPKGTYWELLVAVVVVILAPWVAERIHIPGLIGLLVGGMIIGPNMLGLVESTTGIVKELGDVGLLYLMFLAGLELDLAVFQRYRRNAIVFAFVSFAVPFSLGVVCGHLLGYEGAASVLLGSLFGSHTLVSYLVVRALGLATNRAVATAVGATVITDTIALIVLAVVSGTTTGQASGPLLVLQVSLGLAILLAFCFGSSRSCRGASSGRSATNGWCATSTCSALCSRRRRSRRSSASNRRRRLLRWPRAQSPGAQRGRVHGPDRVLRLRSADPDVPHLRRNGDRSDRAVQRGNSRHRRGLHGRMHRREADRGNADEADVQLYVGRGRRPLRAPVSQAAATLAATFIGLEIGLLDTSAVNAMMLSSSSSLRSRRSARAAMASAFRSPRPTAAGSAAPSSSTWTSRTDVAFMVDIASRVVRADGGSCVRSSSPVTVKSHRPKTRSPPCHRRSARRGIDAELEIRYDTSVRVGLLHGVASHDSSLVVVPAATESWLPTLLGVSQHALVAECPVPVALVRGGSAPAVARCPGAVVVAGPASPFSHASRGGPDRSAAQRRPRRHRRGGRPARRRVARDIGERGRGRGRSARMGRHGRTRFGSDRRTRGPNGSVATARVTRQATRSGLTIVVVADARSVSALDVASQGLGLVTGRAGSLDGV